jgi:hypothetical protein
MPPTLPRMQANRLPLDAGLSCSRSPEKVKILSAYGANHWREEREKVFLSLISRRCG